MQPFLDFHVFHLEDEIQPPPCRVMARMGVLISKTLSPVLGVWHIDIFKKVPERGCDFPKVTQHMSKVELG